LELRCVDGNSESRTILEKASKKRKTGDNKPLAKPAGFEIYV